MVVGREDQVEGEEVGRRSVNTKRYSRDPSRVVSTFSYPDSDVQAMRDSIQEAVLVLADE